MDQIRAARDALDHASRLLASQLDESPSAGVSTAPVRINRSNTQLLIEFVSSLSLARSESEVADAIIRSGVPAMGAISGVVSMLRGDHLTLRIVAATGLSVQELAQSQPIPIDTPVPMTAVVGRSKPLWFGRIDDLAVQFPAIAAEVVGQTGALAVMPFWSGLLVVGVLSLRFDSPQPFLEDQREDILAIARLGGASLERGGLRETVGVGAALAPAEAPSTNERFGVQPGRPSPERQVITGSAMDDRPEAPPQLFHDAAIALAASVARDDTLTVIGPLIVPALADFCVIHLVGERDSLSEALCFDADLESVASVRHLSDLLIRERHQLFSPAQLLLNEVLVVRNGQSAVREILPTAEWFEAARKSDLDALAMVPIAASDRALGVLTVGRRNRDLEFLREELNLLLSIAGQIGQTLENAQRLRDARLDVQEREEFLSIAAHELRTPLTAIIGYNHLLMQQLGQPTPDLPRASEITRQILRQSRRLDELISDLLDVTRIQRQHLDLHVAPCDLVQIVRDSIQRVSELPEWTPAHRLQTSLPPALTGNWDWKRLEQVVTNLVSNAVKYSPSGGRITVGARNLGEIIELSVADQGIGIAPEDQPKLFQPFSRSAHLPTQIQGVGLGLYIVSNIIHHHHGAITIHSELGNGTTFVVLIPRNMPHLNGIWSSASTHR